MAHLFRTAHRDLSPTQASLRNAMLLPRPKPQRLQFQTIRGPCCLGSALPAQHSLQPWVPGDNPACHRRDFRIFERLKHHSKPLHVGRRVIVQVCDDSEWLSASPRLRARLRPKFGSNGVDGANPGPSLLSPGLPRYYRPLSLRRVRAPALQCLPDISAGWRAITGAHDDCGAQKRSPKAARGGSSPIE